MKNILCFILLLIACDQSRGHASLIGKGTMDSLLNLNYKKEFVCSRQKMIESSPDAEVIFNYARWMQKNNQLKQDENVYSQVERLYRIASENGNAKANINLQNGSLRGYFYLKDDERLRMSQELINHGIGAGYYFVAIYLQHGVAGLQKDQEMALRYMRKAADEGNPQAQAYVGDKLAPKDIAPEIGLQLRRCAAEQGEGRSALSLGIYYQLNKQFEAAIEAFQLGVSAGDAASASFLKHGFDGPTISEKINYLGQQKDTERTKRYEIISTILNDYSYANPSIPEIDEILPLPPAPLPAWDGKLKWLEEREANIPPEKPSEALINQMARDKQLDPATGKPLPESPHFVRDDSIKLSCRNGEVCPVSGYWEMEWWDYNSLNTQRIVRFNQGDILPADRVRRVVTRPWPFEDKIVIEEKMMAWRLIAEA